MVCDPAHSVVVAHDDTLHSALRAVIEVKTSAYLWVPADAINFTPPLSSTVFGDGRALFWITTINNRPAYWVFRGDSRWDVEDYGSPCDAPDVRNFIDIVLTALEDEYGTGRCEEDDEGNEIDDGEPFPAIDDETGCVWGRETWPVLPGFSFEPHPFAREVTILATLPNPPVQP